MVVATANAASAQQRAPSRGGRGPATAPAERGDDAGGRSGVETTAPPADVSPNAWPPQTEQQRAAAVTEIKQRVAGWNQKLRMTLVPIETKYFVFFTDLTPAEARRWTPELDALYARLAGLFAVPQGENLWRGKAAIIVFGLRSDFDRFEREIFRVDRPAGGRCHYERNGNVIVTFFRQQDDARFARVLVHETTHGFFFRYRSGARIPSWLNEGLADVMEYELVPAPGLRQSSDANARAELRKPDALKGFFGERIEYSQYDIARSLSEFMIRQNKKGYVDFINAIKDGADWNDALEKNYGVTLDRLIAAYGQSMGVAGLRP